MISENRRCISGSVLPQGGAKVQVDADHPVEVEERPGQRLGRIRQGNGDPGEMHDVRVRQKLCGRPAGHVGRGQRARRRTHAEVRHRALPQGQINFDRRTATAFFHVHGGGSVRVDRHRGHVDAGVGQVAYEVAPEPVVTYARNPGRRHTQLHEDAGHVGFGATGRASKSRRIIEGGRALLPVPPGPRRHIPLEVLTFLGTPAVALLIAVLIALYVLGIRRGSTVQQLSTFTGESLRPAGMLLLVVGAGAFFGKVISATGIGSALADAMSAAGLPIIVLAYVTSCALRIAQGSATVAIVTTGGIVGPLVAAQDYSPVATALIAKSIAAGSIILSHVNDGGFWIIAKFFNMTVKQTLQTWTVLETILSVVSFAVAGILFAIVA